MYNFGYNSDMRHFEYKLQIQHYQFSYEMNL